MSYARSMTIAVQDASGATLTVNYGTLTGGSFDPAPVPGSTIVPGGTQSYVNGTDNNFTSLGGSILLTPASGGAITISWNWPSGSGASGSVASQSLNGIGVSYQIIGTQTNFPTLQVIVTNAATFQGFLDAAKSGHKK